MEYQIIVFGHSRTAVTDVVKRPVSDALYNVDKDRQPNVADNVKYKYLYGFLIELALWRTLYLCFCAARLVLFTAYCGILGKTILSKGKKKGG